MSEKELHDQLLAEKPDGAIHKKDKCPICLVNSEEENVSDNANFTQEQHEALLKSAVEKASEEAKASLDADILGLNEQLAQAQGAIAAKDEEISELNSQIEARAEEDRLAKLADERAELVRAAKINFTDEQIEDRKMSWAKKDEEEFASLLEDYAAVATAKVDEDDKPPKSNFDGTRETAGDDTGPNVLSAFFGGNLSAAENL